MQTATNLSEEELLTAGAQRGLLPKPDDWHATTAEMIVHTSDRKIAPHLTDKQIWTELKLRGLKDRPARPW